MTSIINMHVIIITCIWTHCQTLGTPLQISLSTIMSKASIIKSSRITLFPFFGHFVWPFLHTHSTMNLLVQLREIVYVAIPTYPLNNESTCTVCGMYNKKCKWWLIKKRAQTFIAVETVDMHSLENSLLMKVSPVTPPGT